jgi:hypothetical protein
MIPKVGGFFRMAGAIFPPVVDGDCAMCDFIIEVREDMLAKCIAAVWESGLYDMEKEAIEEILRALQEKP